ncbi:MAG: hypothetical protein WC373_04890 [Smithella sp.]
MKSKEFLSMLNKIEIKILSIITPVIENGKVCLVEPGKIIGFSFPETSKALLSEVRESRRHFLECLKNNREILKQDF